MAVTARDISQSLVRQARVIDPAISAEVGTPERLLIDLFAQALSDAQVDLNLVSGALDITAKVGDDLDRFLALFGFARQQGTQAIGFATFSRTTASNVDLSIPSNTQLQATTDTAPVFQTTVPSTMAAGQTSITVSIRALQPGEQGNVDANTITETIGQTVFGFSNVTNLLPTTGGSGIESDDEYKVRFQNTVFRNLAGTQDQYTALALAAIDNTKVNVVGPVSRYREYIQVPPVDDASAYDTSGDNVPEGGHGLSGEYTTALSTIPYSKHTYINPPSFVSNGNVGTANIFYRPIIDYVLDSPPANAGDAYRLAHPSSGPPQDTDPTSPSAATRPNVSFINVMPANSGLAGVEANQVVLLEHSYVSTASRNDPIRNITNCVDVFVDGINEVQSSTILPTHNPIIQPLFVTDPTNPYFYLNYQRRNEPGHPPVQGNTYLPLYNQPSLTVPNSITVVGTVSGPNDQETTVYYKGYHYFEIEDISALYGTIRARNGIEFNTALAGQALQDNPVGPYTGRSLSEYVDYTPLEIPNYSYNKNILDLQAALEANKQITTDVLVHKSYPKYLNLDITVMYTDAISASSINSSIETAVSAFLSGQLFGTTIQLSDLLNVIHNVAGVDNVRWSQDVTSTLNKVIQTDSQGTPLTTVHIDQQSVSPEVYQLIIANSPTTGSFTLTITQGTAKVTTPAINWNANASAVSSAINTVWGSTIVSTTGSGTAANPFELVFNATFSLSLNSSTLTGGTTVYDSDFYLLDNELPLLPTDPTGLTQPGLTVRARSQNTWTRAGR